ncbi:CDGSH iron-sulfur domain-containing protein [Mumia zhuanghuii]|uniref:CDGSH iron-sulfur domain-containing protein n=2 Tax=Mumia TaxID=1546255 RepID=A0ABW1QEN9_9ACTN|nr:MULTISPECIES: CDGSH iron-sulfur domain-containing protein [Mumia]KAA1422932.1 CDGSH iron-sulfur domain-containing protein [Mumia zhuanghuii]
MTDSIGTPATEVVLCPGGPALIRSDVAVVDVIVAEGQSVARRPVVALCRCGRTGRAPWCDGTHKLAGGPTAKTLPTRKDEP